jgi:hypothetical protein
VLLVATMVILIPLVPTADSGWILATPLRLPDPEPTGAAEGAVLG